LHLSLKYLFHFIVDAEHVKSIFKIGSIERLFIEIKKKLNLNVNIQNLKSGNSVRDILESDMYGFGLGCKVICVLQYLNNYVCY